VRSYLTYKEPGQDGQEEYPAHWESIPLKRLVSINSEVLSEDTASDFEILYIDIGNVIEGGIVAPPAQLRFGEAPSRARRIVKQGDTIISTVRTYLKAIALMQDSIPNLIASTGFAVLSPKEDIYSKYLSYLVRGHTFIDQVSANSYGVSYPAITPNRLGCLKIFLTKNKEEQIAIAAFLDHTLAMIERFIKSKKRLIELLKQQKVAIINCAVIRGLDPNVPMKPSGIEHLSEIPAHWEVKRAKYIFREINERSETGLETHLSMSQKLGLVETNRIEEKTLQSETQEGFKLCRVNDLVLNRLKAHLGVFARATIPGLVSPDYTVFRLKVDANVQYFEMLFKHPAYVAAFNKAVRGIVVGFLRLYTSEFYDIRTLFPPKEEQDRIMSFIREETAKIDYIISRTNREIELIKEFRTKLISDMVMGKLDVRDVELSNQGEVGNPALSDDKKIDETLEDTHDLERLEESVYADN
jgi:type I restriction enzyme S subunit